MQRNIGSPLQLQRRFVTELELEQVTGISRRTWQKHRLLNRGPRYYKIHGSIRYEFEEVLTWIRTLAVNSEDAATDPHGGARA
jgi:predicted DNA-binding transcriptional regulator AlpA